MQSLHDGLKHMDIRTTDDANDERHHPMITTHPGNGKEVLFFNQAYCRDLEGTDLEPARGQLPSSAACTTTPPITSSLSGTGGATATCDLEQRGDAAPRAERLRRSRPRASPHPGQGGVPSRSDAVPPGSHSQGAVGAYFAVMSVIRTLDSSLDHVCIDPH